MKQRIAACLLNGSGPEQHIDPDTPQLALAPHELLDLIQSPEMVQFTSKTNFTFRNPCHSCIADTSDTQILRCDDQMNA